MPCDARPDLIRKAICASVLGQIEWKDACLRRFRDDPEMECIGERGVKLLMRDYVCVDGHEPEVRRESDQDWLDLYPDDPWLYCLLIPVPDYPEGLFVKMRLLWEDEDPVDDAFAQLVSVHRGLKV